MIHCTKCGKEVGKGHKFCPSCGDKLEKIDKEVKSIKDKNNLKSEKSYWWVWLIIIIIIIVLVGGYNYCNQVIPKQVQETYTEQEPYTVYETRTRTQEVVESNCDDSPNCVCTGRYLGLFNCRKCDCKITESIPTTKYRTVEKTRIVTNNVKRCSFIR